VFRIFNQHSQMAAYMPQGTFRFMNVHPNSICWPPCGVQMSYDNFLNFPGSSHNCGAVVSYSDGHAETHQWTDPRTIAAHGADYHKHAEPSPRNKDIAWMRERTTVPATGGRGRWYMDAHNEFDLLRDCGR